jgi:hypothetical protein
VFMSMYVCMYGILCAVNKERRERVRALARQVYACRHVCVHVCVYVYV